METARRGRPPGGRNPVVGSTPGAAPSDDALRIIAELKALVAAHDAEQIPGRADTDRENTLNRVAQRQTAVDVAHVLHAARDLITPAIVAAIRAGASYRSLAEATGIPKASLQRWTEEARAS